jgi:hypothetical protein
MHPFSFIKAHPVAVIISAGAGMIAGPAVLGWINRTTGISVGLPSVGGK